MNKKQYFKEKRRKRKLVGAKRPIRPNTKFRHITLCLNADVFIKSCIMLNRRPKEIRSFSLMVEELLRRHIRNIENNEVSVVLSMPKEYQGKEDKIKEFLEAKIPAITDIFARRKRKPKNPKEKSGQES